MYSTGSPEFTGLRGCLAGIDPKPDPGHAGGGIVQEHIVIVSGSAPLPERALQNIPDEAILLAADGGLDHALAAGLRPSGVIGDFDSMSVEAMAWAEAHATIARHPADKDATDTELALAFAADMNPARITLVGGGDRLDHTIAAIGALGAADLTHIPILEGWWNNQHVDVIHGPERSLLHLEPGSSLSILALHGPIRGLSVRGVRWPLEGAELSPVVGHGISNDVLLERYDDHAPGEIQVELSKGVATIFNSPAQQTGSDPT